MSSSNLQALSLESRGGNPSAASAVPAPRRRWLTRVAVPAGVLLATLALLAFASREALLPATTVDVVRLVARPVMVSAAAPTGDAAGQTVTVQAPGWVEPDPYPIYATALTNGVVEDVLVLEGERVAAGQVVARMVDDDAKLAVERAAAALASHRAALANAEAQRAAAQTDWENPVARDRQVAVMQAQLAQSQAELAQLPALIAENRAMLDERLLSAERLERFVKGNAATQTEAEEARYRVEAQRAALQAVEQRQPILEAQVAQYEAELAAAVRDRELRVAEKLALEAAKAAHAQALADVHRAEAELAEAELRLSRMNVVAPVDGVVMERLTAPGAKLMLDSDDMMSSHVVHLYDPSKLQVRIDIPLADAAKVSVGQRAKVIVDVLPDREFAGVVTRVVHQADIQRNTLQVKVAIEDPDPAIKPEMLARAKFLAASQGVHDRGDAVASTPGVRPFVPERVLHDRVRNRARVWVVRPDDSTAQTIEVTLGPTVQDGWVEVASGLNPGDVVIATAPTQFQAGARVKVREEVAHAAH